MPCIHLTANTWYDLGVLTNAIIVQNNGPDPFVVCTDAVALDSLDADDGVMVYQGTTLTVPKTTACRFYSDTPNTISYMRNVTVVPVIAGIPDISDAVEDVPVEVDASTYTTSDDVVYSMAVVADTAELSIDQFTGIISGSFAAAATYTVTVTAANAAGSDTDAFDIIVAAA